MSNTCAHLDSVANAVKNYNLILAYYVTCIAEGSKRKAVDVYCHHCKSSNRIHACLECAFFGCFDQKHGIGSHMKDHALTFKHYFAVNINHGLLFCFNCNDYIYDENFEDLLNKYLLEARRIIGSQSYLPWKPKRKEIDLLNENKMKRISDDSYIGLRGIVNVGNGCYVSCIIHVFMHNPVLRDFFLSDKHKCFSKDVCLICEMFGLFQEFYSGKSTVFDPSGHFFRAWYKLTNKSLGVCAEDCLELYQEIVARLHPGCEINHQMGNCNCMVGEIFYGIEESFEECSECKTSSTLTRNNLTDILLILNGAEDSLINILNRKYFEKQLLEQTECSSCQSKYTTYLSHTLKKLPNVICFHMNCFEQKAKSLKKLTTAFTFYEWIDMSPYLKKDIDLTNGEHSSYCVIENRYRLFAVICHRGGSNGGHYTAYVQQRGKKWYYCDDGTVSLCSFEEVLKCEPYLLFYYKPL